MSDSTGYIPVIMSCFFTTSWDKILSSNLSNPSIHKIKILLALSTCTAAIFMDSTILPVALPTIQKDLSLSVTGLQWIINSYLLVIAPLLLLGGKLSDYFGHRRMFCFGMSLFATASFFAAVSCNLFFLILSRLIQGIGGVCMIPSSMAILVDTFSEKERGQMIGFLVAIGSVFLCLGPFLGGGFVEYFSWRYVFALNIPILLTGLILTRKYIPHVEGVKEPFDPQGFVFFSGFFLTFILGLMKLHESGWESFIVTILFILSVFFAICLFFTLKKKKFPFLDYRLFKNKYFTLGNLIIFSTQFMVMLNVYMVIHFQNHLGYTPLQAGLLSLIYTIPVMFLAPLSGYLSDLIGPRIPVMIGFLFNLFGYGLLAYSALKLTTPILGWGLFFLGCAVALIMTPIGNATIASVSSKRRGAATAIYGTIKNAASPLAVVVFGALISFTGCHELSKQIMKFPELSVLSQSHVSQALSGHYQTLQADHALGEISLTHLKQSVFVAAHHGFFWCTFFCFILSFICFFLSYLFLFYIKTNKKS